MIRLLHKSEGYVDQTPGRDGITGLEHALRCAALARKNFTGLLDGDFVALVHDLARPLNDVHHGEIIAEMVRDRVAGEAYEVLRTHGQFQAKVVHGGDWPYQEEHWQRAARRLAGIEVQSFSADYDGPTLTVAEAEQLLREYLA